MIARLFRISLLMALATVYGFTPETGIRAVRAGDMPQDQGSPEDTLQELTAKSRDWSEPSQASEERYLAAFRRWLGDLPQPQQQQAREIIKDVHKHLSTLRAAIRAKKAELTSLSFDRHTAPEELSRLGMELRSLQASLRAQLNNISTRLRNEAGIDMGDLAKQTFWLTPSRSR